MRFTTLLVLRYGTTQRPSPFPVLMEGLRDWRLADEPGAGTPIGPLAISYRGGWRWTGASKHDRVSSTSLTHHPRQPAPPGYPVRIALRPKQRPSGVHGLYATKGKWLTPSKLKVDGGVVYLLLRPPPSTGSDSAASIHGTSPNKHDPNCRPSTQTTSGLRERETDQG